jgi:GTP-binding protein EngB required for normal cell division
MVLDKYSHLKEELLLCVDSILNIEGISGCPCEELKDKLQDNVFNLVVLGQFKRGKTTFINALLGSEILPVAVVPLTSIATILKYGETLNITVYFNDGRVSEIELANLPEYVTEKGNPRNEKDVREVIITYPSPYLKDGVRLIDTPGVGSVYEHNTDVAYQYLPKSDAALFLISVDQPLSKAELDFLKDVRAYSNRIFFLLSKADYFSESDLRESMEFSTDVLKKAMGSEVRIFPVSARLALEGKISGAEDLVVKSRLPQFSEVLNSFLMEEKGKILIISVANNLLRLISQARFALELEMKSLFTPLEELKEKIKMFEKKEKEVTEEKGDFDLLLDAEVKKIINNVLEEDLRVFRQELVLKVSAILESRYKEYSGMSLKQLRDLLEKEIITEVKQAFASWRVIEDEKLAKTFETACRRFVTTIDETVDSLHKFSSELFAVPFDAVKAEALWSTKSEFYYRFKEQPVGIEIVTSSVTLLLPKFIGDKIILNKMKEYLHRVIDLHTAKVGYDFEKKLDKGKLDFRWEMRRRIEATIEGIRTAINKGMTQRSGGEKDATERKTQVSQILAGLDGVKARLVQVQQKVSS